MSPRRDPYAFADIEKEYAEEIEAAQEARLRKRAVVEEQIVTEGIVRRRLIPVRGAGRVDLNIGDVELETGDVEMAIVPLTVEVIRQAAPWIIQQLVAQGLKVLTVAELLEVVTGQEFYSLDDVLRWVSNVLRAGPSIVGTGIFDETANNPKNFKKGAIKEGWFVKEIKDYDYGQETSKKVWYKPYQDASRGKTGAIMNFQEKCAYFQGKRVQAYDSRQAKYRAYKRGYGHGTSDQFVAQAVMGHTKPCAPQLFYTKGMMRGGMFGRRR